MNIILYKFQLKYDSQILYKPSICILNVCGSSPRTCAKLASVGGYQGCRVWWDARIQLQGMGLESCTGSVGFYCEVFEVLDSPTKLDSFSSGVPPWFLLLSQIIN